MSHITPLMFLVYALLISNHDVQHTTYMPIIITPHNKSGVVWLDIEPSDSGTLGFEYYHNYSVIDNNQLGVEYIPFFWCDRWPSLSYGNGANGIQPFDYFEEATTYLGGDYDGWLIILNEPDLLGSDVDGGQCDRTPRQAAYIYKAIKREFPNALIVGPAVSHQDYLNNWAWLDEWYELIYNMELEPPNVASVHTYLDEDPILILNSLFEMLSHHYGHPNTVWVTEFANCNPNTYTHMIETYQNDERVIRYFHFTVRGWDNYPCMNLIASDNTLTELGHIWVENHTIR